MMLLKTSLHNKGKKSGYRAPKSIQKRWHRKYRGKWSRDNAKEQSQEKGRSILKGKKGPAVRQRRVSLWTMVQTHKTTNWAKFRYSPHCGPQKIVRRLLDDTAWANNIRPLGTVNWKYPVWKRLWPVSRHDGIRLESLKKSYRGRYRCWDHCRVPQHLRSAYCILK